MCFLQAQGWPEEGARQLPATISQGFVFSRATTVVAAAGPLHVPSQTEPAALRPAAHRKRRDTGTPAAAHPRPAPAREAEEGAGGVERGPDPRSLAAASSIAQSNPRFCPRTPPAAQETVTHPRPDPDRSSLSRHVTARRTQRGRVKPPQLPRSHGLSRGHSPQPCLGTGMDRDRGSLDTRPSFGAKSTLSYFYVLLCNKKIPLQ